MQLVTMIGAVALLSTSAMAVPDKMEKKSPDHWWHLRDSQQGRHHHKQAQRDSSPSTTDAAASSLTAVDTTVITDGAVMTDDGAYTTEYITLQSGDTSDFGSAYTTMYFDLTATDAAGSAESSHSHRRHHHTHTRKQHISLTSSMACPATMSTSYVTITTSVTVSTFVSVSQSFNSSTAASSEFTPSSPASSEAANSGALASGATTSSEAAGSSTSTPSPHHHTRHRTTITRHRHHTQSSSSSITTSVWVSASAVSVASGTSDLHPSVTNTATTTITGGNTMPTGTPDKNATHCDVHGLPDGNYFLAEYIDNSKDVHVTLLGCYEFCLASNAADVNAATGGCVAYMFYPDLDLGAQETRCKLYGASVAESLMEFSYVPNVWYDLGCGNPMVSH